MKTSPILISAIFGLMLLSGSAMACGYDDGCPDDDFNVSIISPADGATTSSPVVVVAEVMFRFNSSVIDNAICWAMLEHNDTVYFMNYSNGKYITSIPDLLKGEYELEVTCKQRYNCVYKEDDEVEFYVGETPSVPEFPTSAAPVILSILSIGLVKMKK